MNTNEAFQELWDVCVLFDSHERAQAAFMAVFKTSEETARIRGNSLVALARVSSPPPREILELYLVGDAFDLGRASILLNLGITPELTTRQMLSDPEGPHSSYPDPWGEVGRMREASRCVGDLLQAGGHGVALVNCGGLVHSKDSFVAALGDVGMPSVVPFAAWLDFSMARKDDGGTVARSWGMMRHYGAPDVFVVSPASDMFTVERAVQALKYTCARVATASENPFSLRHIDVPLWHSPGRARAEAVGNFESVPWTASLEDGRLVLRCADLTDRENAAAEKYAQAIAGELEKRLAPDGFLCRAPSALTAPNNKPRVLVFGRADGLTLRVTSGMGRIPAGKGTEEYGTAHAEFGFYVHESADTGHMLENLGLVALRTTVAGGIKDWDGLPPNAGGHGYVVVPLENIAVAPERSIALRMFVPVSVDEYAAYRVLATAQDRKTWYERTIGTPDAVASRWSRVAETL